MIGALRVSNYAYLLSGDEKLVYHAQQEDGAIFTSNEDDTVLLLQTNPTPWRKNCIFTEDPISLPDELELLLTVKGAGILKYGNIFT